MNSLPPMLSVFFLPYQSSFCQQEMTIETAKPEAKQSTNCPGTKLAQCEKISGTEDEELGFSGVKVQKTDK